MHCIRSSILQHLGLRVSVRPVLLLQNKNAAFKSIGITNFTSSADGSQDQILNRVIELVKKYDKTNASKVKKTAAVSLCVASVVFSEDVCKHGLVIQVTEKADFNKDLSLDSLDRVELVMAIEEEFSIEIPEEKADKLTCCGDIATYILSETHPKNI